MSDPNKPNYHVFTVRYPYVMFEQRPWEPSLNIYETEQAVVIVADMAGVAPGDLHIDVESNLVRIQGFRRVTPPEQLRRIDRLEIASGPFRIELPLNVPIDPEGAESHYNQGLLEVILPFVRRPAQRIVIKTDGE